MGVPRIVQSIYETAVTPTVINITVSISFEHTDVDRDDTYILPEYVIWDPSVNYNIGSGMDTWAYQERKALLYHATLFNKVSDHPTLISEVPLVS